MCCALTKVSDFNASEYKCISFLQRKNISTDVTKVPGVWAFFTPGDFLFLSGIRWPDDCIPVFP